MLYGIMLGFGEVYGYVGSICVLESTPQHIRGTAYGIAAGNTYQYDLLDEVV